MAKKSSIKVNKCPRSDALYQSLQTFTERMNHATTLADGLLTARIVGEFSAGKTRLLRELFCDLTPPELFPVSSLERQTRLQLEITYSDVPCLSLIEREQDYDTQPITIKKLTQFPDRNDLAGYDPLKHRLRLALPEERLILSSGDGYGVDSSPKRLFLIDTPGWNSGDDDLAESPAALILTGYHNLALVYVSHAARLDGALNANRLREFLEELSDANFLQRAKLVFVLTHCPSAETDHFKVKVQNMVYDLWAELEQDITELELDVFCVEFNEMTKETLKSFRDDFWQCLLTPLHDTGVAVDPWVAALHKWPENWDILDRLEIARQVLNQAKNLLERARKGDEFVVGMNMYRLIGMNATELRKKVKDVWLRQIGCRDAEWNEWGLAKLDNEHPLSDWWRTYWLENIQNTIQPAMDFFNLTEKVIGELTPDIEDLQQHLFIKLAPAHTKALVAMDNSFACLVNTAQKLRDEPLIEKRIATLLHLSMLQARYEDYYSMFSNDISLVKGLS